MPNRALRICKHIGCQALVTEGYCELHKKENHQRYDRYRGSSTERGYDSKWRQYREAYLKEHPLCVKCLKINRVTPATVVDHIIPHKGDKNLFWDTQNHQALCKNCHDKKTAREDGGFGNSKKSY